MGKVLIEKNIQVGLPEELDITFQIVPEFSETQEVICGWNGDDLAYIVSADEQPGGYDHSYYWDSLENTLKVSSQADSFKTLKAGAYKTNSGTDVSYRIYKRTSLGEEELYIYHLINNQNLAYWVLAVLVNYGDIFLVNSEITKIMATAELVG